MYILTRAAGKYLGAYFGASVTKLPDTVEKYLGLTLLPHSNVSLVFTGVAVSVLVAALWPRTLLEQPLRREYPAVLQNLVVGIDATGSIGSHSTP